MNNLIRLSETGKISGFECKRLISNGAKMPDARFLPKIHKDKAFYNLKVRPIVNCFGAYHYNLSKFIADRLVSIFQNSEFRIKDSFSLSTELRKVSSLGKTLFSLDIENLYPSVPLNESIDMAMELMERHNSLIGNKTQTRILFETCLKSEFEFEGQIYKQSNGISI